MKREKYHKRVQGFEKVWVNYLEISVKKKAGKEGSFNEERKIQFQSLELYVRADTTRKNLSKQTKRNQEGKMLYGV